MTEQERGERPITLVLTRHAGAGALAVGLAVVVDAVVGGVVTSGLELLEAFGLGLAVGALFGLGLGLAFALVSGAPGRLHLPLWLALGLASALALSGALNVFHRLSGPYARLALVIGAVCLAGGCGFGLLAAGLQPRRGSVEGWLDGSALRRELVAALALLLALGLGIAEANASVLQVYPAAQLATRLGVWVAASAALTLHYRLWQLLSPRLRAFLAAIGLLLVATGLAAFAVGTGQELQPWISRPQAGLSLGVVRRLTDLDGDGYSSLFGGGDCAPLDPEISPGATELPGNGVDEDCAAGDRAVRAGEATDPQPGEVPLPERPSPLSVVLITADSVRADHTGLLGYSRPTTPNLLRLAAGGTVFELAYASAGWTSLSIPSIMRGLYGRHLSWTRVYETSTYRLIRPPLSESLRGDERVEKAFTLPLQDPHRPLAWWLARRGMATAAVVDDGRSEFLTRGAGAAEGFERYVEINTEPVVRQGDRDTADEALRVLESLPTDRPFFLWVHFYGPHAPSTRDEGAPWFGEGMIPEYDHELAFTDQQVGRLLDALDARGGLPAAVIFTSDHGEVFDALNRSHGTDLFECTVRVPLVVRAPGFAGGVVRTPVSLVDLMPTILALTETPAPPGLDGVDLAHSPAQRAVFMDLWRLDREGQLTMDLTGAADGVYRLIVNRQQNLMQFNHASDFARPPETIAGQGPQWELERALRGYLESSGGNVRLVE